MYCTVQVTEPQEYVPLINCIMNSDFPPEASDVCLEMLEITTTSAERVRECAESDEGFNLLHDIGLETESLDPALTGVPWLLFNEVKEKWWTSIKLNLCLQCRSLTEITGSKAWMIWKVSSVTNTSLTPANATTKNKYDSYLFML